MPKSSHQRDDTKQINPTSNPHTHPQQTTHKYRYLTLENTAHHQIPQTPKHHAQLTHAATTPSLTNTQ